MIVSESEMGSRWKVRRFDCAARFAVLAAAAGLASCAAEESSTHGELDGAEVIGWVDGVTMENGEPLVVGWACSPGRDDSVAVHVYVDAPAGSGAYVKPWVANSPSEPAIAAACGAHGASYRFRIPLSRAEWIRYSRHAVFVHAMSPIGVNHALVGNSGAVSIPQFDGSIDRLGIEINTELHPSHLTSGFKYGYAPSILQIEGTYHMWYCSEPGEPRPLEQAGMDSIRYATSSDGRSWSTPQQVMTVTALVSERSTCDPSVVAWQGMYYLFYGGNRVDMGGAIFVARAYAPQGPWLKLTERNTWEQDASDPRALLTPVHPVREIDVPVFYGVGQPSVVVKDNQLTMWFYDDTEFYVAGQAYTDYTKTSPNGGPVPTALALEALQRNPNKHYVATTTDPASWPTRQLTNLPASAVAWDDASKRYQAIDVGSAHDPMAHYARSFSSDGIAWSALAKAGDLEPFAHNIGLATDARGFLLESGITRLIYGVPHDLAFLFDWGHWDLAGATAYEAVPMLGAFDADGDGRADPALIDPRSGALYTASSATGAVQGFGLVMPTDHRRTATGDFNGDRVTDRVIIDDSAPGGSRWYVIDGRTGAAGIPEVPWGWQFGGMGASNRLALGDYDGDGKTDRAIVVDAAGGALWCIIPSTLGYGGVGTVDTPWGWQFAGMTSSAVLALADYDGDGRTDKAIIDVTTPGGPSWYIIPSTLGYGGVGLPQIPWGWQWTSPWGRLALGDFDGDHRTDLAVVEESDRAGGRWYIRASGAGYAATGTPQIPWGSQLADSGPQTQLVLGDYDGDGKTDRAVVTRDCHYRITSSATGGLGAGAISWDWQMPIPTCRASTP